MAPVLRIAEPADAAALAALAEATFRSTFGDANNAADLALHCTRSYGEAIQRSEIVDPQRFTLLATFQDALVAFAQLRWDRPLAGVPGARVAELQRLYVDTAWHGRGLAQALMNACLEACTARDCEAVWLGVWEHNPRATAFYRKFGFSVVGEHVFQLGEDAQRDLIMAWALPASARQRSVSSPQ